MILFLQGSSLKDLICFKKKFMLYSVCDFFSEKNINENYEKLFETKTCCIEKHV